MNEYLDGSRNWRKVDYALKHAPLTRGVYFIGMRRGGDKVKLLYVGSTHTQSNLRSSIRQVFTGGSIDVWDKGLGTFLSGASKKHLLVDWIALKFPQDTIGDYVLEHAKEFHRLPRFNPPSEYRWSGKNEPFMHY